MRILLKLKPIKWAEYNLTYNYYVQSFIYNLIRDTKFSLLHGIKGYKFFSFSNIFSSDDNYKYLIIASPNNVFINILKNKLNALYKKSIHISNLEFILDGVRDIKLKLKTPITLTTVTPIIIRIPQKKYKIYGIKPSNDYEYIYWRSEYPLELFIEALQNNIDKKYKTYYNILSLDNIQLNVKMLKLNRQVSTRLVIHGKEHIVIGTLWNFIIDDTPLNILNFIIDCGFGERNSLGFGFINIKR